MPETVTNVDRPASTSFALERFVSFSSAVFVALLIATARAETSGLAATTTTGPVMYSSVTLRTAASTVT